MPGKHTLSPVERPWRAERITANRISPEGWAVITGDNDQLTNIDLSREDAQLIAGAPELLDVLHDAYHLADRMPAEWVAKCRALLAKIAEGRHG